MAEGDLVFIIPFRDRWEEWKTWWSTMQGFVKKTHASVLLVHQADQRTFNRGATKNIGARWIRRHCTQESFAKMTLVFHDVDTLLPASYLASWPPGGMRTLPGIVRHFTGFGHALGGIVAITGGDFAAIGGFPNLWTWGYEDNALQQRVERHGLRIDRSVFVKLPLLDPLTGFAATTKEEKVKEEEEETTTESTDKEDVAICLTAGRMTRELNPLEFERYALGCDDDTWMSLSSIVVNQNPTEPCMIDVLSFASTYPDQPAHVVDYDIRQGPCPLVAKRREARWF
jgi:hypothetical protein